MAGQKPTSLLSGSCVYSNSTAEGWNRTQLPMCVCGSKERILTPLTLFLIVLLPRFSVILRLLTLLTWVTKKIRSSKTKDLNAITQLVNPLLFCCFVYLRLTFFLDSKTQQFSGKIFFFLNVTRRLIWSWCVWETAVLLRKHVLHGCTQTQPRLMVQTATKSRGWWPWCKAQL